MKWKRECKLTLKNHKEKIKAITGIECVLWKIQLICNTYVDAKSSAASKDPAKNKVVQAHSNGVL